MINKPYSDWLRIDLHIHTDKSNETKFGDYEGDFSVDVLHSKLVENNVSIFSLTDHNIVNVDAYEEYYSKYNSENDPLLLVGIELDIEKSRGSGEVKNYHTLLIFNYLNIEGARIISKALENKYLQKGLSKTDRKITFGELSDIFFGEDFFFIPHAGNSQSIVAAHGKDDIEDAQRMVILMQSAIEKVSREETQQYYNAGFDRKKPTEQRAKNDIAYINFSDNHNISKYPCKHKGITGNHDFYYIKGSENYETIRLAFIDPESRIMSPERFRTIRTNGTNIERFRISSCDFINEIEFEFSPSLNVIIGGRSSGKSLLLWLLCKSIDSLETKDGYNIENINTIIKTINDRNFKEIASISKEDIIKISQGEIVRYFEEKQLKDLAFKVGKKIEYQSITNNFSEHNAKLNEIQNQLVLAYNNAYEETLSKTHLLHAKTINDIQSRELDFSFDSEALLYSVDKTEEIDEILSVIETIKDSILKFSSHSLISLDSEQNALKDIFLNLINAKEKEILELQRLVNSKLCFIDLVSNIITETNSKLDIKSRAKTEAKRQLSRLKETIKSKIQKYCELKICCDEIENFEYALNKEISLYENIKLVLEVSEDASLKTEVLESLLKSYNDISIYKNMLSLLFNKTTVRNHKDNKPESFRKKLDAQLNPIKNIMLIHNDYLRYSNTETSKDKSPGYNSEKYLEIILKQESTKLILIDQPEDNLGNSFISKSLVKLLREIKHNKQLFLVTHNPSIVVYGDADTIILAENTNNEITYKQIKLEDKNAQKEICDILDGGEYIFKKRSQKYDIKSILNE
jgi:predicted ATP-dependent endonuclease of OLD family